MTTENLTPSDKDILDQFVATSVGNLTNPIKNKSHFATYRHQLIEKGRFSNEWIAVLEISDSHKTFVQMQYCEPAPKFNEAMTSGTDRILFNKNTGEILAQDFTSGMNELVYNDSADKKNRISQAFNIKPWYR